MARRVGSTKRRPNRIFPQTSRTPDAFVFATCAPTSNGWLKRDVLRLHPELRFAFSRPGLVTWKAPERDLAFKLRSPVARVSGFSFGRVLDVDELEQRLLAQAFATAPALHVFKGASAPDERDADVSASPRVQECESELRRQLPGRFLEGVPQLGGPVVDVVLTGAEDALGFVGWHLHDQERTTIPGGVIPCAAPAHAPSRTYAKLVELLSLAELDPAQVGNAVEIGAAPGGGTLAMLERGIAVTAIDPAPLAPEVIAFRGPRGAHVTPLLLAAADVQREQLPKTADLLVTDANLAPAVSIRYLERLCKLLPPRLGVLITLKVNDPRVEATLDESLERLHALAARLDFSAPEPSPRNRRRAREVSGAATRPLRSRT